MKAKIVLISIVSLLLLYSVLVFVGASKDKADWNAAHTEVGTVISADHTPRGGDAIIVEFEDGTRVACTGTRYQTAIEGDTIPAVKEPWDGGGKIMLAIVAIMIAFGCLIFLITNW